MTKLNIISAVVDGISGWFSRRHERKMAEHGAELEEIRARSALRIDAQNHLQAWEIMSITNSGWKDEYITILFTLPVVAAFFPQTQPYVEAGFTFITSTPMWYQMVLFGIVGSALGVRIWDHFRKPVEIGKQQDRIDQHRKTAKGTSAELLDGGIE